MAQHQPTVVDHKIDSDKTALKYATTSQGTKAQPANCIEVEDDENGFEVDEWGFRLALDEIKDAPSAEDAAAVLELLLHSRPTRKLLEENDWEKALMTKCVGSGHFLDRLALDLCNH